MSTLKKTAVVLLVLLSITAGTVKNAARAQNGIDKIVDISAVSEGRTLVEQIENETVRFSLVDCTGRYQKQIEIPQSKSGEITEIADFAVDGQNRLILIRNYLEENSGEFLRQELETYDLAKSFPKRVSRLPLDNEKGRWRWIQASGAVVLMGTNLHESMLYRMALDPESLGEKQTPVIKGEREYVLDPKEGIYQAVTAASDVAYMTRSGKVFRASEEAPASEVYPARVLERLMYPMFLSPIDRETVLMGERESGDLCILNLKTGDTQTVMAGSDHFTGTSDYSAYDVLKYSAIDRENFSVIVKNNQTGFYDIVVSEDGICSVVSSLSPGTARLVLGIILDILMFAVLFGICLAVIFWIIGRVHSSRTILAKLAFSAIPLLLASFAVFGMFSYRSYSDSVEQTFQKQVEDEGNLLTALFGTQSFNEIEFPYDYTGAGYSYLQQQMSTRDVYTRTAYYENNQLYIGVDEALPCFYPLDLIMDSETIELYRRAAMTGFAQSGVIEDQSGRRISCVTPIGGVDGSTVYLLETGILTANKDHYTHRFLWRFVLTAVIFVLVISVLLLWVFRRILHPLARMKTVLEAFSTGDRKARMETSTQDELADISRVFNKMAGDIDVQFYNLKSMNDTYYRFVPQRVFQLMGRNNLGDLELGTHVEGVYNVLCAELAVNPERTDKQAEPQLINRFFNMINNVANEYETPLITEGANLCSLKIICSDSGDQGVNIALSALAQIDSYNAREKLQNRMDVTFILHRTQLYCGICGDRERYIPALISQDLEELEQCIPLLRRFSSRLLVTQSAYETVESEKYFSRFIGEPEDCRLDQLGLYDFYDESSPELIRRINSTKSTFDKAVDLYRQGRYYDAKNLFALVLRENQYDNIARYYIFQCEKKL